MSFSLNCLWKKESPTSNLYIDYLTIEDYANYANGTENGHEIHGILSDFGINIPRLQSTTIDSTAPEKNNSTAEFFRATGSVSFKEGDYLEAMRYFNSSLGIAKHESNEAVIALVNRSKCFFYMNMPKECLTDIEMVKMTFPSDVVIKELTDYETKCKNLMEDEQFKQGLFKIREPSLSFKEHDIFPGVAECLKLQRNRALGHRVITKCDLKIGETILVEEPFAIAIEYVKKFNRCWCCFGENKNFITCEHCVGHLYCDQNCMEKSFHKYECNHSEMTTLYKFALVRKMLYKINDAFPDVNHLINTVEMMLNGKDVTTTNSEQRKFCMLFRLVNNHEILSDEKLIELRTYSAKTYFAILKLKDYRGKFETRELRRFLQHLILHLFHIAAHAVNLLEYDNYNKTVDLLENDNDSGPHKLRSYAKGMYSFACQMNHSCIPNVLWTPVGHRLVCKVIRPIQKGEQIFYSYFGSVVKPDASTKTALVNQYNFKCECLFCANKLYIPSTEEVNFTKNELFIDVKAVFSMKAEEFRKLSPEAIEYLEKNAIKFLNKFDRFHPINEAFVMQQALQIMWHLLSSRF